ncbi:TetR/AcrR family transcriptional regulator [Amycolatopsis methanolica]|nr:TetR/AcrR family transcriptional regulator [Amycolatopsis methanolica]
MTTEAERTGDEPTTRERMLVVAASEFSKMGYDGVSLRKIEREAGVNRGLASYHFGSKYQLWQAAVSWLMDRFHDEMTRFQDVLRVVSKQERGRILVRVLVHFAAKYPEFFRLVMLEGGELTERSRWLADEHVRRHIEFFHKLAGTESIQASEKEAIAYYSLLGAASTVFSVPAQCRQLFGMDPQDERFVDVMADRMADLYLTVVDTGITDES